MRLRGAQRQLAYRASARAALATAVSVALLLPSAAAQASAAESGRIVFDRHGNIYTELVRADGTGGVSTQLTTDGHSGHAQWSPNGSRLVFERGGNLYTMSAAGTQVTRLTQAGSNYQPTWSRTGKQIAFVHVEPNGHGEIFLISASGGAAARLTHDSTTSCGDDHPNWSPTSNVIVFHQSISQSCLQTTPSWTGNRILTVNASTHTMKVLFRDHEIQGDRAATVDDPVFLPDGQHLSIFARCGAGSCVTWLTAYLQVTLSGVLIDGTYTFPDSDGTAPELLPDHSVSPDGKWLVASVAWGQDPINDVLTTYKMGTSDNRPGLAAVATQHVAIQFHPDWQPAG